MAKKTPPPIGVPAQPGQAPTETPIHVAKLFDWQKQVKASKARYRVCVTSQQIGKTTIAVLLAMEAALAGKHGWWVAPDYSLTEPGYDMLEDYLSSPPFDQIVEPYKQRKLFTFRNGGKVGTIQVKSADDPKKLRGKTLDFVIMDECAFMAAEAWHANLRHRLTVRHGWALMISNPFGKNWLWELWKLGDPTNPHRDPDYESFQFSQYASPLIDPAEIEKLRLSMPKRQFEREVMGQFVDDGGEVFIGVRAAAKVSPIQSPIEGHSYTGGLDFGSRQDKTEVSIIDETIRQQVACYSIMDSEMERQWDEIERINKLWKPRLILGENNNLGDTNLQVLTKRGLPIETFNTNRYSKRDLIEAWAAAIEMKQCLILNDPELIKQHEAYESDVTPHGTVTYSAPSGIHDDKIIASALSWRAVIGEPVTDSGPSFSSVPVSGLYGGKDGHPPQRRDYSQLWRNRR